MTEYTQYNWITHNINICCRMYILYMYTHGRYPLNFISFIAVVAQTFIWHDGRLYNCIFVHSFSLSPPLSVSVTHGHSHTLLSIHWWNNDKNVHKIVKHSQQTFIPIITKEFSFDRKTDGQQCERGQGKISGNFVDLFLFQIFSGIYANEFVRMIIISGQLKLFATGLFATENVKFNKSCSVTCSNSTFKRYLCSLRCCRCCRCYFCLLFFLNSFKWNSRVCMREI